MLHKCYNTDVYITFICNDINNSYEYDRIYSKLNIMEYNDGTKKMLLVVDSIFQVICNMVSGYRNKLSILILINAFVLRINTQNYLYGLEFMMLNSSSDTFF